MMRAVRLHIGRQLRKRPIDEHNKSRFHLTDIAAINTDRAGLDDDEIFSSAY